MKFDNIQDNKDINSKFIEWFDSSIYADKET